MGELPRQGGKPLHDHGATANGGVVLDVPQPETIEERQIRANDEVALHVWVALEELAGGQTRTAIEILGRERPFPAYRVGDHVVWGMTERIISPFIDLLV